jgi:hypothetical protein
MDNIKMNLGQIGWGDVDWIGLAQYRDKWRDLVNTAMNRRVPSNAGKFLNGCTTNGLSSSTQLHGVSQYICNLNRTETLLRERECVIVS